MFAYLKRHFSAFILVILINMALTYWNEKLDFSEMLNIVEEQQQKIIKWAYRNACKMKSMSINCKLWVQVRAAFA